MKKRTLYIGIAALCLAILCLAMLFLLLINIIKPAEENVGLGSDPENILNGGYVAEDEEHIYYSDTKGNGTIYKVEKDSLHGRKIATNILGAKYLNVAGKYIYYTEGHPGFIWKMSKNGIFRWPVLLKQATNVIISGDRIYYRLTLCDGIWVKTEWLKPYVGSIYSCDLNGRNKKLISKEEILRFVVDGDYIYYSDENYALWRMDTSGNNKENIYPTRCSLPEFDEKYIFFSDGNGVYRMDKKSLKKEVIHEGGIEARNLHGDWIYYTQNRDGDIYRMSKDGKTKEFLLESDVVTFNVAGNFIFFELPDGGFCRFDLETRKLTKISDN